MFYSLQLVPKDELFDQTCNLEFGSQIRKKDSTSIILEWSIVSSSIDGD